LEAGLGHPLEIDGRNDLIGVDIAAPQRKCGAGVAPEGIHDHRLPDRSAGELSVPVTAVAAATSGDTRCVRPPLPCRPSKLRFEVDAARSPGESAWGVQP